PTLQPFRKKPIPTSNLNRPNLKSINSNGIVNKKPIFQTPDGKLKVMALGGLEEVGRNCMLFEYDNDIIMIDMGLQFPEEDMPGIDYIIPNIDCLRGKEKNIKGVIITHGHYDHIGGIPHLMGEIGNPTIYIQLNLLLE
ncbi:MBL fold metallo-hydrolase, partial [Patescibacteria group bacterium]